MFKTSTSKKYLACIGTWYVVLFLLMFVSIWSVFLKMQRNILNTYLHHLLSFKKMNSRYVVFSRSSFCILRHATTCAKRSHRCFMKHERSVHTSHSLGKRILDESVHTSHSPGKRILDESVHTSHSLGKRILDESVHMSPSLDKRILDESVHMSPSLGKRILDESVHTSCSLDKRILDESVHTSHSLSKRILDEIAHYYHGFRLLGINIKVASRMVWKILHGGELSRREHKSLVRTVSDIFRLVPFSVFILVPFMELLLPVFIKLFPQMLPSTFESASEQEKRLKGHLKVKLEVANFIRETLEDTHSHPAKEFASLIEKVRSSGGEVASNDAIMKFSNYFEDEMTLDNLPRPSLIALCRLLELSPIGSNNLLRFQLRMRLRNLKYDDKMIIKDGIDSLTVQELQSACRARGMRSLGLSKERLKTQLKQWLELSLNEAIPPSLLLLSRALYLPENLPEPDQLKAALSSLPDTAAEKEEHVSREAS